MLLNHTLVLMVIALCCLFWRVADLVRFYSTRTGTSTLALCGYDNDTLWSTQRCTRLAPHQCTVNGPCNGLPNA